MGKICDDHDTELLARLHHAARTNLEKSAAEGLDRPRSG